MPFLKKTIPWPLAVMALLVAISIWFRWLWLDHIPGITGDEAWTAVQARLQLRGQGGTWLTPSGRLQNPFYSLPTLALQAGFEPGGLTLRLPACLSGILAVLLAWPLLRRVLPERSAKIASVWIACLPILIAYSRIAWEPSQIPLASLLVTYFSLRANLPGIALSLAAAVLVHSVDILLLPIAIAPWIFDFWREGRKLPSKSWLAVAALALLGIAAGFLITLPKGTLSNFPSHFEPFLFWKGFGRLFSGVLAYAGFAATPSRIPLAIFDALFSLGLPGLLIWRFRTLSPRHRAFAAGVALSMLALFITAGQLPLAYGHERHALFLAIPTLVVCALLWPTTPKGLAAAYVLATAWLVCFGVFYFAPIIETGGTAHTTYRTGSPEPKVAAAKWILSDFPSQEPLRIVAEDWWVYWVVYLFLQGGSERPIEMKHTDHGLPTGLSSKDLFTTDAQLLEWTQTGGYAVGFAQGSIEQAIRRLENQGHQFHLAEFTDFSKKGWIKVWSEAR